MIRTLSSARSLAAAHCGRVCRKNQTAIGSIRWHGGPSVADDSPRVKIVFLQPDGETRTEVEAIVGESLLQTAHRNDIDLEGACEGGMFSFALHR